MSLLSIIQNASARIGLPSPDNVAGSNDEGVVQMLSLLNQEGLELSQRHNWQVLIRENEFITVEGEPQDDALPQDFNRFVNGTFFNRTEDKPIEGPLTASDWQLKKASNYLGVDTYFRVRGGDMLLMPIATPGHSLVFEYVSTNWVEGDKSAMTEDDDNSLLDEELLTLGCIWRYLQVKGLDYAQAFQDYETRVVNAIARDGGVGDLDLNQGMGRRVWPNRNVVTN